MKDHRFIGLFDIHVGWERYGREKKPVHNAAAIDAVLEFKEDFKPTAAILGGDQLDLACISHWTENKHASTENLSLDEDVSWLRNNILDPLQDVPLKRWHNGNHCRFLQDLIEKRPSLRDTLDVQKLCGLKERHWEFYDCGEVSRLGKLYFCHGENVRYSKNVGQTAVEMYQRSIRFGHHHTYSAGTLVSPLDIMDVKTGVAIPCLCHRGPKYGNKSPNRWLNGFLYGYVDKNGNFNDYVVVIRDGQFTVNGKTYGKRKTVSLPQRKAA